MKHIYETYAFAYMGVCKFALASVCARVALLIHHATRRHIVISGLTGSTKRFHIISQTARFSEKPLPIRKACILIFSKIFNSKRVILRKIQRDIVMSERTALCKIPVILVSF